MHFWSFVRELCCRRMSRKSRNIFGETIPELFLLQRKNSKTFFDMSWSTEEGRTCCKKKEKKRKLHSLTSPLSRLIIYFRLVLEFHDMVVMFQRRWSFHFLRKLAGCSWEEWSKRSFIWSSTILLLQQQQPCSAKISTGFAGWQIVLNFSFGIEPTMLNTS